MGVTEGSFQPYVHLYFLLSMNFAGGSDCKESAGNAGDPGSIPGLGRSPGMIKPFLGKGMATHSSILTWIIPWREELSGLQLMESQSCT